MRHISCSLLHVIVIIILFILLFSSFGRAHGFKDLRMSQLEYLYARHDDNRLARLSCAKALDGDAEAAFYLGALMSEPESLYYRPKTAFLWLTIARDAGYEIAGHYTHIVFPHLSLSEIKTNASLVKLCKNSDFQNCEASDSVPRVGLGWPPETKFRCNKKQREVQ